MFELFDCGRDAWHRHDLATVHVAGRADRLKIRSEVSSANAFDTFRGVTTEFKME